MKTTNKVIFFSSFQRSIFEDDFIVHMSSCVTNKDELFKDLVEKLKFPDYFGYNWDAVWDLLRDFYWIPEKKIIIVYEEETHLEPGLQDEYFKLLIEASEDWKENEDHFLQIVFPDKLAEKINLLLKDDKRSFT